MSDDSSRNHDDPTGAARRLRLHDRVALTYRYLGLRTLAFRVVTLPLRPTPLGPRLRLGEGIATAQARANAWYRVNGRPVSIVIPTYGEVDDLLKAIRSIRRTTKGSDVEIVITDDASPAPVLAKLQAIEDVKLVLGEENGGFAVNANRGIAAADPTRDVVLLNTDVVARRAWLAALQHAAYAQDDATGIVGARLVYPDGRIQHAGVHRNPTSPEWFDHRYRGHDAGYGPALVMGDMLAVTGACMYVKRDVIDAVGPLDERYPMAFEDVDWCLRAWDAGFRVVYQPAAVLEHRESATRGREIGDRERTSKDAFWARWHPTFNERNVRTPDGRLRVIYVTEDTGVGGGHRDIFEHLDRLLDRGHDVQLFTLGPKPDWFSLRTPVTSFADYAALGQALSAEDAIKVATWWHTGHVVWRASVLHGIPVFFVQDIETSYYPNDRVMRHRVLAGYRREFKYMTISGWNQAELAKMGVHAELMAPGIDLETFRPLDGVARTAGLLALGRTNPLKNLPLTIDAWRALPQPRPELTLFGIEPELGPHHGARYVTSPSDEGVNELLNEATVFVQTSTHEGFCLPPLEAMATGAAVVCTDAHGNRDFCRDGENCLMADATVTSVRDAIARLLADSALRSRLGGGGRRTAAEYAWEQRIDALEGYFERVANHAIDDVLPSWLVEAGDAAL